MNKTIESETADNGELNETELEAVVGGAAKKTTWKTVVGKIYDAIGGGGGGDDTGGGGGGGIRG